MLESIAIDKLMFLDSILGGLSFIFLIFSSFLEDKINEMKRGKNNG